MRQLQMSDLLLPSSHIEKLLNSRVLELEAELYQKALNIVSKGNHHTWGLALHDGNQTWVGLDPETIQTPYQELAQLCILLGPLPGATVVDLGAGYGRLGLVLKLLFPEVHFLGLEYVEQRVNEGNRIFREQKCLNSKLVQQDIAIDDFILPQAEYYFIYDYGTVAHIRKTLGQIEKMAASKSFKVIARGKGVRSLIDYEHPWLSQVFAPHHQENYSIYSMSSLDNL